MTDRTVVEILEELDDISWVDLQNATQAVGAVKAFIAGVCFVNPKEGDRLTYNHICMASLAQAESILSALLAEMVDYKCRSEKPVDSPPPPLHARA